jgi:hypothetical protein
VEPGGTDRAPGHSPTAEDVGTQLDRIEAQVAAGTTDLSELGFWGVVGRVKRDPALVALFGEQVGRIDAMAFRARVRLRAPVWAGNLALVGVLAVGVVAILVAAATHGAVAGLALLVAGGAWSLGVHSPTHWLVGRLVGIRCTDYFLGGPPPPRPGVKIDYATYLRTPARARAWFHASGAIATKVAPFVAVVLAPLTNAPTWAVIAMILVGLVQIGSDVAFSVRSSDWKKFRREMAVARAVAGAGPR